MSFSPNKVDRSSGISTLTMRHSNSEAGQQFMTMKSQTTRLHQIQSGTGSQLPKIKQARAGLAKQSSIQKSTRGDSNSTLLSTGPSTMFSRKGYSSVKNSMIQQNIPPQHNSNGSKVSRTQAITNQLSIKDKVQSQKTEGNQTIGGIRVRPMRMMSRTSSLNEKVAPNSEVKSCKNSSLMQNGNQSQGAFNFVNTEKKEQFKPSPTKNAGKDKIFPDDKSYATLKTESTNHSNGTGSKGSSEKSSDENTDSQFSSMFFSPQSRSRKRSVKRCPLNNTEVMTNRWVNQIKKKIPSFDVEDSTLMKTQKADQRRQTAPEYSQSAYLSMMKKDKSIGNYFSNEKSSLKIEPEDRESMVSLIQELHRVKEYSEETFYIAVCVADRYLSILAEKGAMAPNLIQLGTISLLLAAKMNQHMNPCFEMMIDKLPNLLRKQVNREQLIKLEEKIIYALDFDLQHNTALPFLERYQRILKLDTEKENNLHLKIGFSARKLLRHMMHKSQFLQYKSSQIAATAILVAIDLNKSEVEKEKKRNQSMSPQKTVNGRRQTSQSRFNTEKKSKRGDIGEEGQLPVFNKHASSSASKDFDDMLAMGDDCDLRKKGDESTVDSSVEQSTDEKVNQQTSFQKVWSKEVTNFTKVSKSKDILPVLRDLVASLE